MTRDEIEAVRNHINNIPAIGAMYAPVLLKWLTIMLRQRDEALKQSRFGWERHAEKDRAYGKALCQRDEAIAELRKILLSRDSAWTGGHDWQEAVDSAASVLLKLEGERDG